jgi:hypothetical protein
MRRIAALIGSVGSTDAIMHSLSEWGCFLAVSFWRRLSSAKAGSGNAESANTTVYSAANADFVDAAVH